MRLVFDCEADGLLDTVTSIHCISFKDLDNGNLWTYTHNELNRELLLNTFRQSISIIGHNIIGYDIPLIYKIFGIDLIQLLGKDAIVDTLIMSQVLHPDRELPAGCPTSIKNPVTGKSSLIGRHGLESWGWRVGHKKVEIHDWRYFTPAMVKRCETDVLINEKVYYALLEEAGLDK